MKVLNFSTTYSKGYEVWKAIALLIILALVWPLAQQMVLYYDETAGYISAGSILLLMLISVTSFLVLVLIAVWLFQRLLIALGLPGVGIMVLQFKKLELWQQISLYWASFFLLLLAAVGCLIAIC